MGIFDRLSTMIRSNLNDLITRAENPEKMLNQLILTKSFPEGLRRVREHKAAGHRTVLITGALGFAVEGLRPLFDEIVCRIGGSQRGYALYGHSAGGQFVHRYVAFADAPRMEVAVAANSGWYTMPTDAAFPYGWGGDVAGLVVPERAFQRPLTILLGTADNDRNHPSLRKNEETDRQGLTRYDRGHGFLAAARERAGKSMPLRWQIAYAPGIGHDNGGMAPFAVPYLTGGDGR